MSIHLGRVARVGTVAWLLVLAGCQDDAAGSESSVCPACDPRAGGETSDFGGSPTACGWVSLPAPIDADEAEALGYDIERIRRLVEREIDVELHWEALATEVGEPARGYQEHTRVRGRASLGEDITHVRPDPQFCDGTTCTREETSVEQATCAHFVQMEFGVELETLDGAIRVEASGDVGQWAEGFEDMIGPDTASRLIGHAYANLRDVTGKLELFAPDEAFEGDPGPTAVQGGHPFPGTLSVELEFFEDETHGYIQTSIWWETTDEHGDNELETYEPLRGMWPADD